MEIGSIEIVVTMVSNLFSTYITSRFLCIFFKSQGSKQRKIVRFFCYALYFCITSASFLYFDWPPLLKVFINLIGSMVLAGTYAGSWRHRICAAVAIVAIGVGCENIAYRLLMGLEINSIVNSLMISSNLLFFIIVLLLQKAIDLREGENVTLWELIPVTLIPTCSLFISVIVLDNCENEALTVAGDIALVLINVFVFYLLDRIQKMYQRALDVTVLEQQNQAYENQLSLSRSSEEKIIGLRHDMKNHLFALKQLAGQGGYGEVEAYLDSLTPLTEPQSNFASTGNPLIDSFLNLKLNQALEIGAEIETTLKISKGISVPLKDISIILGNLLDNALSALAECNSKKVLNIVMEEEPGKLFIQVDNAYSGAIKKVGDVFKTSKAIKEGHGIGLKNVRQIVTANDGDMDIQYTGELFSVKLMIFIS